MKKEGIKMLLEGNYLKEFKQVFTVCHYHRTKVCAETGIGYWRLCTIIADPSKMTIGEVNLLADYFGVNKEFVLKPIDGQLANASIRRSL